MFKKLKNMVGFMRTTRFLLAFVFAISLISNGLAAVRNVDGQVRYAFELKTLNKSEAEQALRDGYVDLWAYACFDEAFVNAGLITWNGTKITKWMLIAGDATHSYKIVDKAGNDDKSGSIAMFAAPNSSFCGNRTGIYQNGQSGATAKTFIQACPTWAYGSSSSRSSGTYELEALTDIYCTTIEADGKRWYCLKLYQVRFEYKQLQSFYVTFYRGDAADGTTSNGASNFNFFAENTETPLLWPGESSVSNQDWSTQPNYWGTIAGGVEVESDPEFVVSAETACGGSDLLGTLTVADGKWAGKTWANYDLTSVSVSKGTNSKTLSTGSDITISLPSSGTAPVPFTISPEGYTLSNGEYATELILTLTDKESNTSIEVKCNLKIIAQPKTYFGAMDDSDDLITPRRQSSVIDTLVVSPGQMVYGYILCAKDDDNLDDDCLDNISFVEGSVRLKNESGVVMAGQGSFEYGSKSIPINNHGKYFVSYQFQQDGVTCEATTDTVFLKVVKPLAAPVLELSTNCGSTIDARATVDADSDPTEWEWIVTDADGFDELDDEDKGEIYQVGPYGFRLKPNTSTSKLQLPNNPNCTVDGDEYPMDITYNTTAEGKTSRFFITNIANEDLDVTPGNLTGILFDSESFDMLPSQSQNLGDVWGTSDRELNGKWLSVRCKINGEWTPWFYSEISGSMQEDTKDLSSFYLGISATTCVGTNVTESTSCQQTSATVEANTSVKLRLYLSGTWKSNEPGQKGYTSVDFDAQSWNLAGMGGFVVFWQRREKEGDPWVTFASYDDGVKLRTTNTNSKWYYLEEEIMPTQTMQYRAVFGRYGCFVATSQTTNPVGDIFQGKDEAGAKDDAKLNGTSYGNFDDEVWVKIKADIITGTIEGRQGQGSWRPGPEEICNTGSLDLRLRDNGPGVLQWQYSENGSSGWIDVENQTTNTFNNVATYILSQATVTEDCMYQGCTRYFRVQITNEEGESAETEPYKVTVYKVKHLYIDALPNLDDVNIKAKDLKNIGICDGTALDIFGKINQDPLDEDYENFAVDILGSPVIELQEATSNTLSFSFSAKPTDISEEGYLTTTPTGALYHAYRLVVTNGGSIAECTDYSDTLIVKKNPPVRMGSCPDVDEMCAGSEVTLTVTGSSNINRYNWKKPVDSSQDPEATELTDEHTNAFTAKFPISMMFEDGDYVDGLMVEGWGIFGDESTNKAEDTIMCPADKSLDVQVLSQVCTTPAPEVSPNPICSDEEVTLTWSDAFDASKHKLYDSVNGSWNELNSGDYEVTQNSPTTIITIKKQYTATGAASGVKFRIDDQISTGTASTLLVVNPNPEKPANVKASADPTPVCEHASTTISVTHDNVDGYTYIYKWTKQGDDSYTNSNKSFTFSGDGLTTAQAGIYYVTISVRTPAGCSAESDQASTTLSVNEAATKPTITLVNGPNICAGESHTFTPTVSPEPAQPAGSNYTYTWTPQGNAPSGTQNDKDYTLNTAANDQGGNYSYTFKVKVTTPNSCADSTEQTVRILVNPRSSKPEFTKDLTNTAVCPGETVTISATVSNATTYQWYKTQNDGTIISRDNRSSSNTLTFTASASDNGYYRLLVISGNPSSGCADSTWSSISNITVYDAAELPTVSFNPNSSEVCEGTEVNIHATVGTPTVSSTETTYHWTKGGSDLASAPDGDTYTISAATLDDAGSYTLEVTNTTEYSCVASASASYTLRVIALPDLESASVSTTATDNKACTSLVLTASAKNAAGAAITSGLSYQWQKLNGSDWQNITNATSVSYTVTDLGENQEYRCLVTMGLSGSDCSKTVESSPITVTVLEQPTAPTVSIDPASKTICAGGDASFTATVTPETAAVGDYTYAWSGGSLTAGSETNTTLNLSGVTATATYTFTVTETNDICSVTASKNVTLTVTKPTNLSAIAIDGAVTEKCINEGSINLKVINVETGSPLQELKYQWFKDGVEISGANSITYTVLAELANNGIYTCKVTATASDANPCEADKTTPEVEVSFTMCGNETLSPGDAAEQNGETALVCEKGDQDKTIQVSYEPTIEKDAVTKVTWMKYETKPGDDTDDGTTIKSAQAPIEWKFTLNHSDVFTDDDIAPKQYYVRVKIERGDVVSYSDSYRFVKVKNAPVVTASMQPIDTLVCVGSDVYFTANGTAPSAPSLDGITGIATSSEALQYEWKTPGDTKFLGGNQRQKATTEVAITDSVYQARIISGYKYTVSGGKGASNTCYDTSNVAQGKISVKDAPVISLFTDEKGETSRTICVDGEYPTLTAKFEHAEDTMWRRLASSGDYVQINTFGNNPFTAALLKEDVEKPIKGQESAIENVIQVVASNDACPEVVKQYTLIINPTPNLDSVGISAEDQYCNSTANTIRAQAYKMKSENRREENNEDVAYRWQVSDDGTSGWRELGNDQSYTFPAGSEASEKYYRCIATAGSTNSPCPISDTSEVKHIRIYASTQAGEISPVPEAICSDGTAEISLVITAGEVKEWKITGNGSSVSITENVSDTYTLDPQDSQIAALLSTTSRKSTLTVTVTVQSGEACADVVRSRTIDIYKPHPGIQYTLPEEPLCSDRTFTFGPPIEGEFEQITWSYAGVTKTESVATEGLLVPASKLIPKWEDDTTYTMNAVVNNTKVDGGCDGVTIGEQTFKVGRQPLAPKVSGEVTVCEGSGYTLSAVRPAKSALTWSVTKNGEAEECEEPSVAGQTETLSLKDAEPGVYVYTIKDTTVCGEKASTHTVTVLEKAVAGNITLSNGGLYCAVSEISFTASAYKPEGATIQWQTSTDTATTITNENTGATISGSSMRKTSGTQYFVRYVVKGTSPCGDSASKWVPFKIFKAPEISGISVSPSQICEEGEVTIAFTATAGYEYKIYSNSTAALTGGKELASSTVPDGGNVSYTATAVYGEGYYYVVISDPSSKAESTGNALNCATSTLALGEVDIDRKVKAGNLKILTPEPGGTLIDAFVGQRAQLSITGSTPVGGIKEELLWQSAKKDATPDYEHPNSLGNSRQQSLTTANQDTTYYWVKVSSTKGICPADYSDTVRIAVTLNANPTLEIESPVCENSDIRLTIGNLDENGKEQLEWDKLVWQYRQAGADDWITITEKVSRNDGTETFIFSGGLPAGEYEFQYQYQFSGGEPKAIDYPATLTVDAMSEGGYLWATDTVVCVGGSRPVLHLGGSVGLVQHLYFGTDNTSITSPITTGGDTSSLYRVPTSNTDQSGWYQATVKNGACAEVKSDSIFIRIVEKPVAGTLDDQIACYGETATITYTGGKGDLITWQKASKQEGPYSDIEPAPENNTYTTDPLTDHIWILVTVNTHSVCGPVSVQKEVKLYDTLKITTQPVNYTVTGEGQTATFTASAGTADARYGDGGSLEAVSPKDYKWQKSTDGGGTWEDITTGGDYEVDNGTLTVNNAETHTDELYRCVITSDPCDRDVTSSTAAITAKAGLVPGQTKSRTECDCYYPTDSVIYFVDGASGEGALHYRWQISKVPYPDSADIYEKDWVDIENEASLAGAYITDSNRIIFKQMRDLLDNHIHWIRAWVGDENSPEQPTAGNFVAVCKEDKPTYFIENEEIDVCERESGEEVSVFKMLASSSIDGRYVSYAYALKTDPATFTAIDMPETGDSEKETTVSFDGGKQLTFTVSAADSNLTIPAKSAIPFAADSMVIRMEIRSCYTPDPDINTDTTIYRLLRVDVPVTITERALDTIVCAGSDFTMETGYSLTNKTIAGNQVTAQWYQVLDEPSPSGTQTYPASQDGRAVLLIENAATEKSGTWYVDLSTSHCPAVSDSIIVGVHKVPAFKGIIEPAKVCEDDEAVLTATIDADEETDYSLQWQRKVDGEWVDITEEESPYSGVNTKTLTVNPASKAEAGEYRLQLTGTIASCAAESWAESSITVKLKPQIALNPAGNVAVQEGKIHNGVSVVVKSVEDMLGYSSEYLTIAEITAYQWWALFPDDENGEYEQFDKLSGNMEVVEGNAVEQTIRLKGIEKYDSTLFYAKVITECSDTITSQSDTLRVTDKFDVDKVDVSDAVCANNEENVFEVSVTTTLEMQQNLCFWEISKNNGETWERIDEAGVEYETDFAPNKFTLRIKNLSYDMNGWQLRATVSDGESTVKSDDNGRVITISLLPAPQFVCADVLEKSEDAVMINGTPVLSEFNVKEDCLPQSDITPDPGYSYSYWVKAPGETESSKMQETKQYNFVPDGGAGLYYVFFAVENACGSATVMDSVWVVEELQPKDVTAIATTTPGADPDDPKNSVQGPSETDLTVDICEDNTLYLTASYTGGPAQGVVWKKDGETLNISAPYSLRGDTLVISPVSRDMNGAVFTCLFDMPGSIEDVSSQNITLTVNRKPDASMAWVKVTDITAQEEGEELEPGQALPGHTVVLSVEDYEQTPTQVCFYKAVINPEDSTVISVEKLGCNDAGLTYTLTTNANLLVHDNTWYYARIYNDCGYDSTDISNLRIFDDLKVVWIADTLIERPSGEEWDYTTSYPNPKPGELVVLYLPGTKPGEQDQIEAHEWVCENGTFTIRDTTLQGFMNMQTGDAKIEGDPNYHRSRWYYRTSPTEEWRVLSILDFVDDDAEVLSWEVWEHKGDLTLLNITSDKDGWQFFAVGENELFADTTCVVTLHVIPALQKGDVTMEPEQISACFEAEAKFELRSELDLSKLTIDWQIKPADGEWSEKIDSLTNSTVYDMGTVGVDYNGYQVRAIVYGPCGRDTIEGEISITDPVVPGVMLLGDTVCLGESLLLTAQDTGNAGWLAFAWYVNDELVPDQTEATFDMGAYEPGEYKVRVEMAADTLTHGCVVPTRVEAEASVRINVLPEVKAYAQDSVIKAGAATVVWAEGNGTSYRWSPANNVENASDSVTNTVLFETHGTYVFKVTATNEFGCEASDTVVVVVQSNFRLDSIVAETVTPPLTPNGEGRLPGFPDNGYGVDDEGAKIVRTAVFTENEAEVWVCPGDEVRLAIATSGGESPITYTWTIDGGNAAVYENGLQDFPYETKDSVVVMFFPDSSTKELYCHIVDDFGEELDIVVHVHYFVPDFIYIETRPKTTSTRYYEDQAVYFHARPQRYPEYYWIRLTGEEINPDITEVVTQDAVYPTSFKMNENGEYYNAIWVSVIDRNGCRLWDSTGVELMKLPNVMVIDDPNRPFDGVIFPEFEVEITNMWGLRIKGFTDRNGNGSSRGWDGRTPSGTKVTGGTYYYRVKIPTLDGFVYMTGAVTVINR